MVVVEAVDEALAVLVGLVLRASRPRSGCARRRRSTAPRCLVHAALLLIAGQAAAHVAGRGRIAIAAGRARSGAGAGAGRRSRRPPPRRPCSSRTGAGCTHHLRPRARTSGARSRRRGSRAARLVQQLPRGLGRARSTLDHGLGRVRLVVGDDRPAGGEQVQRVHVDREVPALCAPGPPPSRSRASPDRRAASAPLRRRPRTPHARERRRTAMLGSSAPPARVPRTCPGSGRDRASGRGSAPVAVRHSVFTRWFVVPSLSPTPAAIALTLTGAGRRARLEHLRPRADPRCGPSR